MSCALLPRVMVAPNGARRGRSDHPRLPVTISEIVATASECYAAGAGGLHAHVRDSAGQHVLDGGLYRELLDEMARVCPDMAVQITTEAVGRYSPSEQRALVRDVMPRLVSVGLHEMLSDGDETAASAFYHWAEDQGISVQHILYSVQDVLRLGDLLARHVIVSHQIQALYVLGRYTDGQVSSPHDLDSFLDAAHRVFIERDVDWMVCAFGLQETACLRYAFERGGKARVGFENNLYMADGTLAQDNAARVREVLSCL